MTSPFYKDPDARKDYGWDWSPWLAGDSITGHEILFPLGQEGLVLQAAGHDATSVTIWLEGGTPGRTYPITCRITTASGRTEDDTIRVRIRNT